MDQIISIVVMLGIVLAINVPLLLAPTLRKPPLFSGFGPGLLLAVLGFWIGVRNGYTVEEIITYYYIGPLGRIYVAGSALLAGSACAHIVYWFRRSSARKLE